MSASQAPHANPRRFFSAEEQKSAAVYLGQLSASTYASLPPRMQAACREMAQTGEITIENMPELLAGGRGDGIRTASH